MNEAKLSYTIKVIDKKGWDELFSVRSEDPAEYFKRISALKKWLVAQGYTPTAARNATNATGAAAPVCEFHGPMKASKYGGYFCPSKMGDDSYCKSKSDAPPPTAASQVPRAQPMGQGQAIRNAANGTQPMFDEGPPEGPPPDSYYTEN